MALAHKTLTLSGAAQSLLAAFGAAEPVGGPNDPACSFIALQGDASNGNPIFVGDDGVTTTDYGTRLPIPVGGVPAAPFVITYGGPAGLVRLSSCFVIGTATEKLHILYLWA